MFPDLEKIFQDKGASMKQQLLNAQKLFNDKNRGFRVNSESDLYDIIVHQLPSQIKTMVSSDEYRVKGSIGQGNITTHPWISILNTDITATTQEGLYVVLLFNSSFDAFYVSLNQGITYFKNKYRSKRYEYALQMAQYYRQELGERSGISYAPIDLKASKRSLAYGYEKTNIASKRFEINNLDLQELENTIHKFVDMYDEIVQHMPLGSSYDDVVYSVLFSEADAYVNADDAIKSIKNVISKEVRIPSGVKQRLVLMTAGKERTQKFKKLSSPITKKPIGLEKLEKTPLLASLENV